MTKYRVLLVEDDQETADDFLDDLSRASNLDGIHITPPDPMYEVDRIIKESGVMGVILDERLHQYSPVSYLGVDLYNFIKGKFHGLPIFILTEYPAGPEFEGQEIPVQNFVRKMDLENDDFRPRFFEALEAAVRKYAANLEAQIEHSQSIKERIEAGEISPEYVTKDLMDLLSLVFFDTDPGIERIIWFDGDEPKSVRVLFINRTAISSDEIAVFRIKPTDEIPFEQEIAEVTPKDWEKIESGEIALPQHWDAENSFTYRRDLNGFN